jgi:hypothetical protein
MTVDRGCPNGASVAYKVVPVGTDSNVDSGPGKPSGNPYGGCRKDGSLAFPLQNFSHWNSDRSKAEQYSASVTIYGSSSITDTDGFSSSIYQNYVASPSAATTYICGTRGAQADQTPIIYNTTG